MGVPQKKRATIKPKISKKWMVWYLLDQSVQIRYGSFWGGKGARAGLYSRLGPAPTMDEV